MLDDTYVVPDIDVRRWAGRVVEVVDPMKRPALRLAPTVDPDENWYWFHAAQVPNDGFSRMVRDIQRTGASSGDSRMAIMDGRGGSTASTPI